MLPTFIIGLREGLEASLIIGIIAAFLTKSAGSKGTATDVVRGRTGPRALSGSGGDLEAVDRALPHKQQEGLETVLALVAVVGVTYMVVWMKRHSRELKGRFERSAESALVLGSAWALIGMAFFAVLREGLETAVFLLAVFGNSTRTRPLREPERSWVSPSPSVWVSRIYKGGVRINLSRFFRFTGFVLVLVAAGLLSSAVHTAHEAGWTALLQAQAFDLRWLVAPGSVRAALLTGMLGLQPIPTVGETMACLLYAIPMSLYVLWPARRPAQTEPSSEPVAVTS